MDFFLMKTKSQTISILRNFFVMVQNQFKNTVKILRNDNGAEFLSNECQNMLRALLFKASIPVKFWGRLFYMLHIY